MAKKNLSENDQSGSDMSEQEDEINESAGSVSADEGVDESGSDDGDHSEAENAPVAAPTKPKMHALNTQAKANAEKSVAPKKGTKKTMAQMVTQALETLNSRNGVSLPAIKKYVNQEFDVDVKMAAKRILSFLKQSTADGMLVQIKGSYRLAKKETKAKKVVKPKAKAVVKVKGKKEVVAKKQPAKKATKPVNEVPVDTEEDDSSAVSDDEDIVEAPPAKVTKAKVAKKAAPVKAKATKKVEPENDASESDDEEASAPKATAKKGTS